MHRQHARVFSMFLIICLRAGDECASREGVHHQSMSCAWVCKIVYGSACVCTVSGVCLSLFGEMSDWREARPVESMAVANWLHNSMTRPQCLADEAVWRPT